MAVISFVMAGYIIIEKTLYPEYPLQGWPSVMTAKFLLRASPMSRSD